MRGEWKPGDALVISVEGQELVGIVCEQGLGCSTGSIHAAARVHVHYADGDWDAMVPSYARPLVVIDPEDREHVERLAWAYNEVGQGFAELMDEPWTMPAMRLRQALREFANPTPPKPEEPTGLGAVVEDSDGRRWVRVRTDDHSFPWDDGSGEGGVRWRHFAAVRVLSEGVTA